MVTLGLIEVGFGSSFEIGTETKLNEALFLYHAGRSLASLEHLEPMPPAVTERPLPDFFTSELHPSIK